MNDIATKAVYLEVEAEVRYWEDATVNGQEDEAGTLIPFKFGSMWCPVIRLEDGKVISWPEGTTARIHYKVCDAGEYWLADEDGRIAKWAGSYVPNEFLCHGPDSNGYGDYIIFKVGPDGLIQDWRKPTIEVVCDCEDDEDLATPAWRAMKEHQ